MGDTFLPHPRFRGGMPSSASSYKGEGKNTAAFFRLTALSTPVLSLSKGMTEHIQESLMQACRLHHKV